MQIKINGSVDEVPDSSSIRDILTTRNLPGNTVIVALNDEVVTREKWENQKLNPHDCVEIIRVIGGG